jgi:hypothetical protein
LHSEVAGLKHTCCVVCLCLLARKARVFLLPMLRHLACTGERTEHYYAAPRIKQRLQPQRQGLHAQQCGFRCTGQAHADLYK